jgi:hypothetical protein
MEDLKGKKYIFEDGSSLEIIQIKNRELNEEIVPFITYHISGPKTIPRKLIMPYNEFVNTYGHMFGLDDK